MIRNRCPEGGMMVKARSFGSAATAEVICGTGSGVLQISKKSAPTDGPCMG